MCSNLLVAFYYASCLCMYRLALRKKKYVRWFAIPIYSVFATISKRRFLHRKKLSPHAPDAAPAVKGGFYTYGRENFCFTLPPCIYAYYPNSSVYIFHCLSKERFLHRKNRRISTQCALSPPLYPIRVRGCTMINKREVSTPEKISYRNLHLYLHGKTLPLSQNWDFHTAQLVTATGNMQK